MPQPTLVKSLDLLNKIQRCASHAQRLPQPEAARIHDAVDSLLSALVAHNGLRSPFVALPAEMREHYRFVTLIFDRL
jgi:hypothetical protein